MRATLLCLVLPAALAACATGSARYRTVDGHPQHTSARLDADVQPLRLQCPDDGHYYIVPPTRPYVAGRHMTTKRPYVRDAGVVCARIAAADR